MERGGVGSAISLSRTCPAYLDWSRKQEPIVPRREPGKGGTRGGAAPPARSSPGLGAPGSPLTQPARGSSPGTEREVPLLPRCAHGDSVATLAPASSPFPAGSPEEAVFPARLRWHCRIDGSGWGLAAAGAHGGGGARGRSRDVPVGVPMDVVPVDVPTAVLTEVPMDVPILVPVDLLRDAPRRSLRCYPQWSPGQPGSALRSPAGVQEAATRAAKQQLRCLQGAAGAGVGLQSQTAANAFGMGRKRGVAGTAVLICAVPARADGHSVRKTPGKSGIWRPSSTRR